MDIVLEMYGLTTILISFAFNSAIYKFRTCRFIMPINIIIDVLVAINTLF